jgi:hypothetical protein
MKDPSMRKTEGTINGSIMVDGRPLPVSFQRSAGYVEQLDIHESSSDTTDHGISQIMEFEQVDNNVNVSKFLFAWSVLAQRKTEGTINGSIMVDGRPLPVSFQRSAGYVEHRAYQASPIHGRCLGGLGHR